MRRRVLRAVGERFALVHDRVREVAYAALLPVRRKLLHRRVAEALETLYAGDIDAHVAAIGQHYRAGEAWTRAITYLCLAGEQARTRSAPREALSYFEQALAAVSRLPESASALAEAFDIHLALRSVLLPLGEVRQTVERLLEAEALSRKLDDDRRRGRVLAFMANLHSLLGEPDEARAAGARALAIARTLDDLELRIPSTSFLEQAHFFAADYARVIELAVENLSALPASRIHDYFGNVAPPSVWDRWWLVNSLAELGRFPEAARYAAEAVQLAESTEHALTIGIAHHTTAMLHVVAGDWSAARSFLERGVAVLRTADVVVQLSLAIASSAWVLAQLGDVDRAKERLDEGGQLVERFAARGIVAYRGWAYASLGRASLLLGRLDDARSLAHRALESSARHPGFAARALHLLGEAAAHPDRDDPRAAESHYRGALALAGPRGMRPVVAHCHLGLSTIYRRAGAEDCAREHSLVAAGMCREMGIRIPAPGATLDR